MRGIRRIVVEGQVRIGELIMVEDVKRLSRKYQVEALGKLDPLFERDVDIASTMTRETTAPLVSVTLPLRVARSIWAVSRPAEQAAIRTRSVKPMKPSFATLECR